MEQLTPPVESREGTSERLEALDSIWDEFLKKDILAGPDNLIDFAERLAECKTHLEAMFDLFERSGGASGLDQILADVKEVADCIKTYLRVSSNSPSGSDERIRAREEVSRVLNAFQNKFSGIRIALDFLHASPGREGKFREAR